MAPPTSRSPASKSPRAEPKRGPNREACERVVAALRQRGLLEEVDAAVVTAALELASAVDSAPTRASLWEQYRAAIDRLLEVGTDDKDEFGALIDSLRASVGDTAD